VPCLRGSVGVCRSWCCPCSRGPSSSSSALQRQARWTSTCAAGSSVFRKPPPPHEPNAPLAQCSTRCSSVQCSTAQQEETALGCRKQRPTGPVGPPIFLFFFHVPCPSAGGSSRSAPEAPSLYVCVRPCRLMNLTLINLATMPQQFDDRLVLYRARSIQLLPPLLLPGQPTTLGHCPSPWPRSAPPLPHSPSPLPSQGHFPAPLEKLAALRFRHPLFAQESLPALPLSTGVVRPTPAPPSPLSLGSSHMLACPCVAPFVGVQATIWSVIVYFVSGCRLPGRGRALLCVLGHHDPHALQVRPPPPTPRAAWSGPHPPPPTLPTFHHPTLPPFHPSRSLELELRLTGHGSSASRCHRVTGHGSRVTGHGSRGSRVTGQVTVMVTGHGSRVTSHESASHESRRGHEVTSHAFLPPFQLFTLPSAR